MPQPPSLTAGYTVANVPATPASKASLNELFNPVRRVALAFALAYIFIRYSLIHETITHLLGVNLKLVYLFAPPALVGILLTGGVQRTLKERASWYWLGFTAWMILAIPFSSWMGGSVEVVSGFLKGQISMLFVLAGLAMTWQETGIIVRLIAAAPLVLLVAGRFFMSADSYRLGLSFGSIGNQNDYAAHLLMLLPFTLYIGLRRKTSMVIRLIAFAIVAYGLRQVLATASRGALVALALVTLYALWRGTNRQRLALALMAPIAAAVMITILPDAALMRLSSFSTEDEDGLPEEATQSARSRKYLLMQSLSFTLQHPIFGVGPGQFLNFEGKTSVEAGRRGNWHQTHNTFTQISSECGIPGFLFMVAAIGGTLHILNSLWRRARDLQLEEARLRIFCVMMAFIGFVSAATFLNMGYGYYLPAFTGLAIALKAAFEREFAAVGSAVPMMMGGMRITTALRGTGRQNGRSLPTRPRQDGRPRKYSAG